MKRRITDITFLLVFIAFWVGMIIVAARGFANGDPARLLYFIDYNGNRCGEGTFEDYKYTHWTHPANMYTNVCVNSCPGQYEMFELVQVTGTTTTTANSTNTTRRFGSYDVLSTPGRLLLENTHGRRLLNGTLSNSSNQGSLASTVLGYSRTNSYYEVPVTGTKTPTVECAATYAGATYGCSDYLTAPSTLAANGGKCCTIDNNPAPSGMYICVPDSLQSGASSYAQDYVEKGSVLIAAATGDLIQGWYILLAALGISVIVSFLWTYILKFCAGCFVWSAIILANVMVLVLTGACYYLYADYKSEYDDKGLDNDKQMYILCFIGLIVFGLVAAILLCITVCLCKQIRIAVGIVQESCRAIQRFPCVLFFPLVQYAWMLMFLTYWIIVAIYLASTSDIEQVAGVGYTMTFDEETQKLLVYHFFGLLWNMAFIRHMSILILAGVFGAYYWTPLEDKNANKFPRAPVMASICRSWTYHTGTVALGSFIIGLIQMARAILDYVKKKYLKKADKVPCAKCCSCFIKLLVCYIDCCLWCFEKLVEYISKNAYIVTACKGKMFCTAACEAFMFIINNLGQHAVVSWVSSFVMLLGKMFIIAGTVVPCFFLTGASDDLAQPYVLLVVCGLIAYLVASLFLGVVDTAIDTILVCFCWERDAKGNFANGQVYASDGLNKFISGIQHAKDELAKNKEGGGEATTSTPVEAVAPSGEPAA